MTTKFTCKKCGKNFKVLTKEGLCAYCHKNKTGEWPGNFTGAKQKRK